MDFITIFVTAKIRSFRVFLWKSSDSDDIYLFRVNNRNTRTRWAGEGAG